jgi:Alpha/beta hydrolase of unknown function (DUF900)
MSIERTYNSLPFQGQPKTFQNDRHWLESIIRNAAPFSDWWTKARIVQLAYSHPPGNVPKSLDTIPTYPGLKSEKEIVEKLRSLCDLNQHPVFAEIVNEDYVIKTLNRWKNHEFTQAISRNFEIYADRQHPNIFLVCSTANSSINVDRKLPPSDRFRPLFNVDELARIMSAANCDRVTMRIHGYASPDNIFYDFFMGEVKSLTSKDPTSNTSALEDNHFYIGYHWPSEQPLFSPGLWVDYRYDWRVVLKFLFILTVVGLILGSLLYIFLAVIGVPILLWLGNFPKVANLWEWLKLRETAALAVQWHWIFLTVFMTSLLLVQMMRLIVYQRDRYRAIHYGAPDFSEFFWRLDRELKKIHNQTEISAIFPRISVNLIGHSLGALVVVESLRILSDKFGKDEVKANEKGHIGQCLTLDKLIFSAPDIPLEFLRESRNNYVRSAILRSRTIYLFSSDRDIVLRYLSTFANWWVEPSLEMSGLRLGNVYLKEINKPQEPIEYNPYIRVMIASEAAVTPTSAYDLFEKFNYLDCSEMTGVNGTKLLLKWYNGPLIDLINIVLYLFGKIDAHGAYFWIDTPSFAVVKFLLVNPNLSEVDMQAGINRLIVNTPIRFLPSQPFMSK